VTQAAHGQAALDLLEGGGQWDAVVMDIRMPGMDGLETTRAIRSSGRTWCDVPVVALTAHSDDRTVLAAQAAGMNDFIVKPVDADVLWAKLGLLLGSDAGAPASARSGHGAPAPAGAALVSYGVGPSPANAS
jgi:CheY-like chemotaxis protein